MCWITNQKPVKKVAESDVTVYKIMLPLESSEEVMSYYVNHIYRIGALESTEELEMEEDQGSVGKEFNPYCYYINRGFHSYSNLDKACRDYAMLKDTHDPQTFGVAIYKCIIPEGAVYYENNMAETVSDKIVVVNRADENDTKPIIDWYFGFFKH